MNPGHTAKRHCKRYALPAKGDAARPRTRTRKHAHRGAHTQTGEATCATVAGLFGAGAAAWPAGAACSKPTQP